MSKLLALKEWVTIPEAAEILSKKLNEEVKESDIYHFAVHHKITLSLNFLSPIQLERGEIQEVTSEDFEKGDIVLLKKRGIILDQAHQRALIFNEKDYFQNTTSYGCWDLVNNWQGALLIHQKYYHSINEPIEKLFDIDGIIIRSINNPDLYARLLEQATIEELNERYETIINSLIDKHSRKYLLNDLPLGTLFVIRIPNLYKLIEQLSSDKTEKKLHTKERASLHKLLGILSNLSEIPIQNEYKAAEIIIEHAVLNGIETPSRDTIAKYLKEIKTYLPDYESN